MKALVPQFQISLQALFARVQPSAEGALTGFRKEERQDVHGDQPESANGENLLLWLHVLGERCRASGCP